MILNGKDREIYNKLLSDLENLDTKISKQQVLKNFDFIYSKWFSSQANINEIRNDFSDKIDLFKSR